jgi:hypothetical protein
MWDRLMSEYQCIFYLFHGFYFDVCASDVIEAIDQVPKDGTLSLC